MFLFCFLMWCVCAYVGEGARESETGFGTLSTDDFRRTRCIFCLRALPCTISVCAHTKDIADSRTNCARTHEHIARQTQAHAQETHGGQYRHSCPTLGTRHHNSCVLAMPPPHRHRCRRRRRCAPAVIFCLATIYCTHPTSGRGAEVQG